MIRIDLLGWEEAKTWAAPIRFRVFVQEQGVPAAIELDARDAQCLHALARDEEGNAIATARLLPDGHIGRMAVLPGWRGKGVGGAMLERLVEAARLRGIGHVALSAQTHALGFYAQHGFAPEGEVYLEAGIAHRAMRRAL